MTHDQSPNSGFWDAYRRLQAAQKNSTGAPLYSKVINRPVGRIFAAAAYNTRLSPNQITAISAAFTFLGIVTLIAGPVAPSTGWLVAGLLMVGYALDSADGQLARLRGGGSLDGEWLDHVIDSAKLATIHLAVLVAAVRSGLAPPWFLAVPLVFSIAQNVNFFGMIVTDLVLREHHARTQPDEPFVAPRFGAKAATLVTLARIPTDYGFLCVTFLFLGAPAIFAWIYTLMAVSMVAYTLLATLRWFRLVRNSGAPAS